MRTYDFSPLYRSFVGFDRMAGLIDAAAQTATANNAYPPYNVARLSEDSYKIELAQSALMAHSRFYLRAHGAMRRTIPIPWSKRLRMAKS